MIKKILAIFIIIVLILTIPMNFSKSSNPYCNKETVTFYIQNLTNSVNVNNVTTTYTFNTLKGVRGTIDHSVHYIIEDWYLYPLLAGNFYIFNGTFWIYIRFNGTDNNPNLYLTLYERSPSGQETQIARGSSHPILATSIESYSVSFNTTGVEIPSGYSLHIHFELAGGTSTNYWVYYGNSTYASGMNIITNTSMYISSVETLNYLNQPVKGFSPNSTNKQITFLAYINDPLGGYDIRNVSLNINGISYIMIKISGTEDSYTNIYELQLNYTGWQTGNYTYTVYALDYSGFYYYQNYYKYLCYLRSYESYFWIGFPLKIDITLYTSSGIPVSNAYVGLRVNNTVYGNYTINGKTLIYAYAGTYNIFIVYDNYTLPPVMKTIMNGKVYGNVISISNSTNITIFSDIGNSSIEILTSNGIPIYNALVYIQYPNEKTFIYQTPKNGTLTFYNVGGGIYKIVVYYQGVEVYNSTVNFVFNTSSPSILLKIFTKVYNVEIIAGSYAGINISNVMIFIKNVYGSENINTTNSSGISTFELPYGNYQYEMEYMNTIVSEGSFNVSNNESLYIKTEIFKVNIKIVDSLGNTLNYSYVELIGNGNTLTTISNGTLSYIIPIGNYTINVYWDNKDVNSTNIFVYGNENITINSRVYYLTVNVYDSNNIPLNSSFVIVENNQTVVAFSYKPINTFKLPYGNYRIYVIYKDTYYWTDINLIKEYNVTLNSNYLINAKLPFPIPFYETVLFIVVVIFLIAIALTFIITRKIFK
ncbi:MAG: hypothetical protein ACP5JE_00995 [Thermoplasmata archaeon]